jgi:hypothetical protein
VETIEGCEGSLIRAVTSSSDQLFFSIPYNKGIIRRNMTILSSNDEGQSWQVFKTVDKGAASYSSMQIIPPLDKSISDVTRLALLYERSDTMSIVFEPDEIRLWILPIETNTL